MSDFWFSDDCNSMRFNDYLIEFNLDGTFSVSWYSENDGFILQETFKTMSEVAKYLKD